MTISALSVEKTKAWKAELRWWSRLSMLDTKVFPGFVSQSRLTYLIRFQSGDRQVIVDRGEMRDAIAKRAVTHLLRTKFPGLSRTVTPGALRRLRATLQHNMERDLAHTLDRLERFVEQCIGLFPGEKNGSGFGMWILEQVLRNCPTLTEEKLIAIARNAQVSQVMQQ